MPAAWSRLKKKKNKPGLQSGPGLLKPKIATQQTHLATRTVGRVLTTNNVSQINLAQLLSRATLKARIGSNLSLLLKWTTLTTPKSMHISKIHSMSKGGAHSQVEAYISPPSQLCSHTTTLHHS